jgi:hypothetical protein
MSDDDPSVDELLETLEAARETETDLGRLDRCSNCQVVSAETDVVTKERGRGQLHYCAACDRLLTTDEYETWRTVRDW